MRDWHQIPAFKDWLEKQGKINWRMNGFGFLLDYKGAKCMAMINSTASGSKGGLVQIDLTIRPIIASQCIEGKLAGEAEYLTFKHNDHVQPKELKSQSKT